ncbi:MAG: TorF family putative porin [Beijerinckiaceae bacterium]|nr:TorF family putative porin [Beijerinckiaceae bacterium]
MSFKYSTIIAAAFAVSAPAFAADLPIRVAAPAPAPVFTMFEFAVGGKLMTDYNFRGISQSDRGPAVTAYAEGRINFNETFQGYVGVQGWSVKLPSDPTAEVDIYGGVRATFGALALDVGVMRYWYPREIFNTDFTEFYGKAAYTFNETFTVGANLFYTNNWLQSGASGTYAAATAKVALPYDFAVSGEVGRYMFGTPNFGAFVRDYTYWNAGVSYTYKVATLDLRYHDTTLSKTECFFMAGATKWCGQAFIATLSFDITSKDLK